MRALTASAMTMTWGLGDGSPTGAARSWKHPCRRPVWRSSRLRIVSSHGGPWLAASDEAVAVQAAARRSVAAMPAPGWFFRFIYSRESAAWARRRDEPQHRELVERTADELASVVAPPGPVADLGCGPGAHALALARRGYDVVGVDGSPRTVEVARTRAARDEVDARFEVHDVSQPLRFADASLGGVLAILGLQHLPHPAAFIAEIRRCLRPGGHLLMCNGEPGRVSALARA